MMGVFDVDFRIREVNIFIYTDICPGRYE